MHLNGLHWYKHICHFDDDMKGQQHDWLMNMIDVYLFINILLTYYHSSESQISLIYLCDFDQIELVYYPCFNLIDNCSVFKKNHECLILHNYFFTFFIPMSSFCR